MGNFGPVGNAEGDVEVLLRDFDQAVVGNPVHDLIRLTLSLAAEGISNGVPGTALVAMTEAATGSYAQAVAEPDRARPAKPEAVRSKVAKAFRRTWKQLLKQQLKNTKPTIPIGKRFWPISAIERMALKATFSQACRVIARRDADADAEFVDAALGQRLQLAWALALCSARQRSRLQNRGGWPRSTGL